MLRAGYVVALLSLTACAGYQKGVDAGVGIDALDTTTKEQKDRDKWFKSFYGKDHCVWGDGCSSAADSSETGW